MRAVSVDRRVILSIFAALPLTALLRSTVAFAQDAGSPLASWNDGAAKQGDHRFRAHDDRPLESEICADLRAHCCF